MDIFVPVASMAMAIVVGWGLSLLGLFLIHQWDTKRNASEVAAAKRKLALTERDMGVITPDHPKYRQFVDYALELYNPARPTVRLSNLLGLVWTGFKAIACGVILGCFLYTIKKASGGQWEYLHNWWLYPVWVAVYYALFNVYVQFSIWLTGHGPGHCELNRDNLLKTLNEMEATHADERSLPGN